MLVRTLTHMKFLAEMSFPPSAPAQHSKDSDCTIDPQTELCSVCGVLHGDPCPVCCGRGFHKPLCVESDSTAVRIMAAARDAEVDFWATIAKHFPEIKTGDFPIDLSFEMSGLLEKYTRAWVELNAPEFE